MKEPLSLRTYLSAGPLHLPEEWTEQHLAVPIRLPSDLRSNFESLFLST